jgi:hypothetical protein
MSNKVKRKLGVKRVKWSKVGYDMGKLRMVNKIEDLDM